MKVTDVAILLGKRIKELRELRGLSQAELASKSLKSVETISNFERAKTTPSIETLAVIAKILDVQISAFFEPVASSTDEADGVGDIVARARHLSKDDQQLIVMFVDCLLKRNNR